METVNYNCPVCGAANIQRISLAYLKGTGTTLSNLLSPPQKRTWMFQALCAVGFLVIALAMVVTVATGTADNTPTVWFVIASATIIGVWLGDRATRRLNFNKNVYPILLRNWNTEFICLRCSKRFVPSEMISSATRAANTQPRIIDSATQASLRPTFSTPTFGGLGRTPEPSGKSKAYKVARAFAIASFVFLGVVLLLIWLGEKVDSPRPTNNVQTTAKKSALADKSQHNAASYNAATKRLISCMNSNIQTGNYSSTDGGKSVLKLLEDGCSVEYFATEEECQASGSTPDQCHLAVVISAQAALRIAGK
jgi:hypothetical protein